jgi:hypothetical protein
VVGLTVFEIGIVKPEFEYHCTVVPISQVLESIKVLPLHKFAVATTVGIAGIGVTITVVFNVRLLQEVLALLIQTI